MENEKTKTISFEDAMKELESLVNSISASENMSLEDLIKKTKRAQELNEFCQKQLDSAKLEIEEINNKASLSTKKSDII